MNYYFVTGTGTGVGKTTYTCSVLRNWRSQGYDAIGLKPFATGDREDAIQIQSAMQPTEVSLEEINPIFLNHPMAPLMAAEIEHRVIPYEAIVKQIQSKILGYTHGLVEGAGGWLVPLTKDKMISDFARDLGFPVIVIARGGLGTLNHTLLTIESIRKTGLPVEKIVLNCFPDESKELVKKNQQYLINSTHLCVEVYSSIR